MDKYSYYLISNSTSYLHSLTLNIEVDVVEESSFAEAANFLLPFVDAHSGLDCRDILLPNLLGYHYWPQSKNMKSYQVSVETFYWGFHLPPFHVHGQCGFLATFLQRRLRCTGHICATFL
jgi:hypothetical protein